MVELIPKYTQYSNDEYVHDSDDDDELTPIPRDKFKIDPSIPIKGQPIPSVTRTVKNKMQPTTPISAHMSNKYSISTSDDADDNKENCEVISRTRVVQQAPETRNIPGDT